MATLTEVFSQIQDLQKEAEGYDQIVSENLEKRNGVLSRIAELAQSLAGGNATAIQSQVKPAEPESEPQQRRGRPKGSKNSTDSGSSSSLGDGTAMELLWDVITRRPEQWRKVVDDLPSDVKGLTAGEIKIIIGNDWPDRKIKDATIQQYIHQLHRNKKLERDANRRYHPVKGAKLD